MVKLDFELGLDRIWVAFLGLDQNPDLECSSPKFTSIGSGRDFEGRVVLGIIGSRIQIGRIRENLQESGLEPGSKQPKTRSNLILDSPFGSVFGQDFANIEKNELKNINISSFMGFLEVNPYLKRGDTIYKGPCAS
jgi:hypothetical protein